MPAARDTVALHRRPRRTPRQVRSMTAWPEPPISSRVAVRQTLEEVADQLMSALGARRRLSRRRGHAAVPAARPPGDGIHRRCAGSWLRSRTALRSWLTRRRGSIPIRFKTCSSPRVKPWPTRSSTATGISRGGPSSLRATAIVDRLQVTVADSGVWKVPLEDPGFSRGRGIFPYASLDGRLQSFKS